jgi:membrane fusion protein, multidrug efflux system
MNRNILILTIAFSIGIFSCKGPSSGPPAAGPVPVNVYEVNQEAASYHETYPGTTIPKNEVELRSQVNGFVTNIFFTEGTVVKKGQKLYEIERTKYQAAYEQARASYQVAKSNLDKAQKDADRYTKLGEQDAIAKQRVDYAVTDFQNAKQQLTAAEANLRAAETDLNHSIITAPFEGTIGISLVKRGAFVNAGQTLLNTISSDNPISVDFVINESDVYRFIKLQQQAKSTDSTFTLLMPDKSIYPHPGKIDVIDRAVDPTTGTMKIRLDFPNPGNTLRAGMSCNVRVLNNEISNPLVVPARAITEQMGEYYVYAVKNDTARQMKVSMGPTVGDKVIIKEGLAAGQKVVVDGVQKLREGAPVQIGIPQQPAPGGGNAAAAAK